MTVVIKSYRFDLPPPAFTESNYDKGHWDIIHTLEADLKDYPEFHEMLGIEMIISDRIYDGDNITFEAKYYNKDTGAHIFTSNQSVPDPGDYGYEYWNSYRICSWIGSCHWEISGPMNIRIVTTVKKGVVPIGLDDRTMVVTKTEPTATHTLTVHTIPNYCYVKLDETTEILSGQQGIVYFPETLEGWHHITVSKEGLTPRGLDINLLGDMEITVNISEAPDFWTDPLGWIQFYVLATIEQLMGWTGGVFVSLLYNTKTFLDNFGTAITNFFSDVTGSIQTVMNSVITEIQGWLDRTYANIGAWWTDRVIEVGVLITNATVGLSNWIDDSFSNIDAWWADAQTVWGTFWEERISGIETWISEFTTNVNNWWSDTKEAWAAGITSTVFNIGSWINQAYDSISAWWTDRVVEVGVMIAEATTGFSDWITGFPALIAEWWDDRVIEIGIWLADRNTEIKTWVDEGLPGWIDDMFEWAKPLVAPIKAVADVLGKLLDITEETIERTPEEQVHIDDRAEINKRIREIVEGR